MAKVFIQRGKITAITDKSVEKDGKKSVRCAVDLEVPGKWNPETKSRPTQKFTVWYFDGTIQKASTVLKAAEYLIGKTVVLSYEEGVRGGYIGYDRPTSHGFATCPAEVKPYDEDATINFKRALKTMVDAGELPEYNCDPTKISDLLKLYQNIAGMEGENAKELRDSTTRLFYGAKYAFIGPVGAIAEVGSKGAVRVSVPLYHKKDEEATWVDITFWDAQPAANLLKIVKPGDTVLFTGLYERPEYNGRRQFSGKYWDLVAHKQPKPETEG